MNLSLAWRNIWRNKTRSLIIMASVAIGLFAGIFVLALYEGMLHARVRTVIDTEVAHLQIHHPEFKDDYDPALILKDHQPGDECFAGNEKYPVLYVSIRYSRNVGDRNGQCRSGDNRYRT